VPVVVKSSVAPAPSVQFTPSSPPPTIPVNLEPSPKKKSAVILYPELFIF